MAKIRLDQLMLQRGLAESREKAQRLIRAGLVRTEGRLLDKPGHRHSEDIPLVLEQPTRFVGRGGDKMEGAFESFGLEVGGWICMDVGSSTGGFTDCLLQHGAVKIFAIDTGRDQLHWKLREDDRVVVMEGFNARYLKAEDLDDQPQLAVIDVSFISLTKILPAVIDVLPQNGMIMALIKPQFEAGREQVEKGGVVRDPEIRQQVVDRITEFAEKECGLALRGVTKSPLKGPAGNVEFLSLWEKL